MKPIKLERLSKFIVDAHIALGMSEAHASTMSEVFMRATLRGVGHHDIYDLPGRLRAFKQGDVNAAANFKQLHKYEAMEQYDGDNGSGELACAFIATRAAELVQQYGLGFCTIRHSNHFLASAPYTEMAAERGVLCILYTRTPPSLSNPEGTARVVGTSPMGYAVPTNREYPMILDVCLSYLSNGVLNEYVREKKEVPNHWGKDAQGRKTTDPAAIRDGGYRLPIGGHKGFGLALLTEVLTGVLSGGQMIDQENPDTNGTYGIFSHTAIAMKADGFMPMEEFTQRTTEMIERMEQRAPHIHIPGQGSYRNKRKIVAEQRIWLNTDLVDTLQLWAKELNVTPLE